MDISFLYAVSLFSQSFKELLLSTLNNPLLITLFTLPTSQSRSIRERKDKHYFYSDNTLRKKSFLNFTFPILSTLILSFKAGSKGKHSFYSNKTFNTLFLKKNRKHMLSTCFAAFSKEKKLIQGAQHLDHI